MINTHIDDAKKTVDSVRDVCGVLVEMFRPPGQNPPGCFHDRTQNSKPWGRHHQKSREAGCSERAGRWGRWQRCSSHSGSPVNIWTRYLGYGVPHCLLEKHNIFYKCLVYQQLERGTHLDVGRRSQRESHLADGEGQSGEIASLATVHNIL